MKRRGLLLDRDGVINVDKVHVGTRDRFEFMPGIFPFLRAAQNLGYRLAVLTNQSGVARGLYTAEDFKALSDWMVAECAKEGAVIDLVLGCFEHVDATVPAYARESFWRKPNPGMVLEAARRLRLSPPASAFLGDKMTDMQAAQAGGIGTCLLLDDKPPDALPQRVTAVGDYGAALKILATSLRTSMV